MRPCSLFNSRECACLRVCMCICPLLAEDSLFLGAYHFPGIQTPRELVLQTVIGSEIELFEPSKGHTDRQNAKAEMKGFYTVLSYLVDLREEPVPFSKSSF